MSETPNTSNQLEKLDQHSQKTNFNRLRSSSYYAIGCLIACLTAFMTLDYNYSLSTSARLATLSVLLTIFMLYMWLRHYLKHNQPNIKDMALAIESSSEVEDCTLSTAAQLELSTGHQNALSTAFHEALVRRGARQLEVVDMPRSYIKPLSFITFCATIVMIASFMMSHENSLLSFYRVVNPFTESSYMQVDLKADKTAVGEGESVNLFASFSGHSIVNPIIEWKPKGSSEWKQVPITSNNNGQYLHQFTNVKESFSVRARDFDGVSKVVEIPVYLTPRSKSLVWTSDYPAYTKVKTKTFDKMDFKTLRASELTLKIETNEVVTQAEILLKDGHKIALKNMGDHKWQAQFKATKTFEYWVNLSSEKIQHNVKDKLSKITVFEDKAPMVRILKPAKDIGRKVAATVPIKIEGRDDFGLNKMQLVAYKLGAEKDTKQTYKIELDEDEPKRAIKVQDLVLAKFNPEPFDVIAYYAVAVDNNTYDGPGVAKSKVFFIEIKPDKKADGKPKPPSKGSGGEKINLIELQTIVVAKTHDVINFFSNRDVADIIEKETQAVDYTGQVIDKFIAKGLPQNVIDELQAAIEDMDKAIVEMENVKLHEGLAAEQNALVHLYTALKLIPPQNPEEP